MRNLTEQEIRKLMDEIMWGTIISVDENGQPYAVETSFAVEKRGGRMNRCIEKYKKATFKICDSTLDTRRYRAAIVESEATILKDIEDIRYCLEIIIKKIGWSMTGIDAKAERIAAGKGSLSLYRLPLKNLGGVGHGV